VVVAWVQLVRSSLLDKMLYVVLRTHGRERKHGNAQQGKDILKHPVPNQNSATSWEQASTLAFPPSFSHPAHELNATPRPQPLQNK
jgi:hypothetical protein